MKASHISTFVGLLVASAASPVLAQEGTAPSNAASTPLKDPAAPPAPAVAASPTGASTSAGPAPAPSSGLQEIVVTAQRRSENLQNVPIAITALSGAALANTGTSNILDLKSVVPGLSISDNDGGPAAHLRGVGSTSPGPSLESPVALYVDGVYYASGFGSRLDFVDVSQVSVLKGPQGTLFGRNATGGLIQVTTKDPSKTPTLDADYSYGNYSTSKGDFYVSGPLTDTLAASFSAEGAHQGDGYGVNLYNGKDVNKLDSDLALRSKFLWTPESSTKITAILDFSQNRNSFNAFRLYPGTLPSLGTGPSYGGTPWDTDANIQPINFTKTGGASVKLDQDLPFAHLADIVAYRATTFASIFDADATETNALYPPVAASEHQFSEEFQLQSLPKSFIKWTGGLFYFNEDGKVDPIEIYLAGPQAIPNSPITNLQDLAEQTVTSVAAYGQATAEILPKTNLTVGGRYTYERHEIVGTTTGDVGPTPIVTLVDANEAKNFYRPTFRVSLDHRFSPEVLAYTSFNTGFKSGGYNPYDVGTPAFAAETLYAYEGGVKTDLLDRRLRVDVSGFYYDYRDIQVQELEGGTTAIINGASAHITGVDVDAQAKLTDKLSLHGGLEYLHAHYGAFPNAPISSPDGVTPVVNGSASGNALPFSPKATVDIDADYDFGRIITGTTVASIAYTFNSGFYFEPDNVIHQPNYSSFNASFRWKSDDGHYTASLWGQNLTDTVIGSVVATANFGPHATIFAPPRTYGFTVGYHY